MNPGRLPDSDRIVSRLHRALLDKARAESALLADPGDPALRAAAFAALDVLTARHSGLLHLVLPELGQPLHLRAGTADAMALRRIFLDGRHGWAPARPPRRILDLGAHAGYAAVALARRHPDAEILCVEPDPQTHRLLAMNTLAWPQIRRSAAAVWHSATRLGPMAQPSGFDLPLTDQLAPEARTIEAVPVATLLERAGWPGADMLLCDIAGSEAAVFADPGAAWLRQIETAAIDIRDDLAPEAASRVRACFPEDRFAAEQTGATLVFRRRAVLAAPLPAAPRRLPLLHAAPGLLPFGLHDVTDAPWGFFLLGDSGFQLHPNPPGSPPARAVFPRSLSGQTGFAATLLHAGRDAPIAFAATLADAGGTPLARAAAVLAAGESQSLVLPFPGPMAGPHRMILETAMAPDAQHNHTAWARWIDPAVR